MIDRVTTRKIVIFGGRDWVEISKSLIFIRETIDVIYPTTPKSDIVFISGMAKGADRLPFHLLNQEEGWGGVERFYADWDRYKKAAGFIRNIEMLEKGQPNLGICFPGGSGTSHMKTNIIKRGIQLVEYKEENNNG